jgi:hypothetical protein
MRFQTMPYQLNQPLRQLLIDILEDGYTGSAERQLINGLVALT